MARPSKVDAAQTFEVARRFMNGDKPSDIAQWLTRATGHEYKRESVYPILRRAIRDGFLRLVPPRHKYLEQRLQDRFGIDPEELYLEVCDTHHVSAPEYVADAAAEHVLGLIKEVAKTKGAGKPTRVGLGGGGTLRHFSRSLASRLRDEDELPPLGFHALTSGFNTADHRTAPVSFLSYFDRVAPDLEYTGLFSAAMVKARSFENDTKTHPGIAESFAKAKELDIVVTSLASANDPHGELNALMDEAAKTKDMNDRTAESLRKRKWVGDVLFRPFSEAGPIVLDHGWRAVSLLELKDLSDMAGKPGKHVVLIAAPCGMCNRTKDDALAPLLGPEGSPLFDHLFLDAKTADALVNRKPPENR